MKANRKPLITFIDQLIAATADRLAYFAERWRDEKEYEDWTEYDTAIRKMLDPLIDGGKVKAITKRPMGAKIVWNGWTVNLTAKFKGGSIAIEANAKAN